MPHAIILALCLLAAVAAGCATDEDYRARADFGKSVRHTVAMQTANPGARGLGLDGVQANAVLKAFRDDVALRRKVEQPILISVGGGSR